MIGERTEFTFGELFRVPGWAVWVVGACFGLLAFLALPNYPGGWAIYLVFTVTGNALLYFGFRRGAIFFDTFVGLFLWLGFWLKTTVRLAFMGGEFHEPVGAFDGSGEAFDQSLIVASCGFIGLLVASWIRERWIFSYRKVSPPVVHSGINALFRNHRVKVLVGFAAFFGAVAVSNIVMGIYQRGSIPQTVLPFGLGGVYTWLLLFGLSSFCAVILQAEYARKHEVGLPIVGIVLLEVLLTNVSLLSRGMILNGTALLSGLFCTTKMSQRIWYWLVIGMTFFGLFVISVLVVNHLRLASFTNASFTNASFSNSRYSAAVDVSGVISSTSPLFIDRWVGIEGVLAVAGSSDRGWDLWNRAWQEKYTKSLGFYDANLITSPYINTDMSKVRHLSLPGVIAFFYYPGSFSFVFIGLFFLGLLGGALESFVFRLGGGNLILCSLLSQVVAYRFTHFGYLPGQTYLLFGALVFNVLLIYVGDKILSWWYGPRIETP